MTLTLAFGLSFPFLVPPHEVALGLSPQVHPFTSVSHSVS